MPARPARRAVALAAGLALLTTFAPAAAAAHHPKPTVHKISPASGPTGGGTTITITGTHLTHIRHVRFGAADATRVHRISAAKITVTAPAHHAGTVGVRVTTKAGASAKTSHDRYTYRVEPTSIAAPAPNHAAADPDLRLTDLACPAPGDCWAVGAYHASGGAHRGVLEHLVGGSWQATTAPEPVFADTDPMVTLTAITCPVSDFCVAVGAYRDATDAPRKQALIETYERAKPHAKPTWSGAPLLAPHHALAEITAVSCSSEQSCAAVGSYLHGGVRHALLETYDSGGGWLATDAPLPLNAEQDGGSSLAEVDCPAKNTCFAVGSFLTTAAEHTGLLERYDSSGQWTSGRAKDASSGHADPRTHLAAVSCASKSFCAIGGRFTGGTRGQVGFIETWADSDYSDGKAAPVPPGSADDPEMSLTAVSCAAAGDCAATSTRTDAHGHQVGALLTLAGKQWHAVNAPLQHAAASPHVALTDLACGRVAVGSFTDTNGRTRPVLETLGHGWTGRTGPLPASAGHGAASLAAVECDPGGRAIAVGRYVDSSGRHRGMITRDVPA